MFWSRNKKIIFSYTFESEGLLEKSQFWQMTMNQALAMGLGLYLSFFHPSLISNFIFYSVRGIMLVFLSLNALYLLNLFDTNNHFMS